MTVILKRKASILALILAAAIALPACSASVATEHTASPSQSDNVPSSSAKAPSEEPSTQERVLLSISANGVTFTASFEDNSSAEAFADLLKEGPLTLSLHDYGSFEKVGPLGTDLPTNDAQITTQPGDVILYQGNQVTIYYDTNTWSFTRLARIDGVTRDDLLAAFGEDDVEVTFELALDG